MDTINGNILDIKTGVIVHQVNCQRIAGAGLALKIRNQWPHWYEDYRDTAPVLGTCKFTSVDRQLWVASLYAQDNLGLGVKHTNYDALKEALQMLRRKRPKNQSIFIPIGMGAGLGGGNWTIILGIIKEVVPFATLVRFGAAPDIRDRRSTPWR